MNALTMKNSQPDSKIVVVSQEGIVRPVALATEQSTHQCVVDGDILIYKNFGSAKMRFNKYGKSGSIKAKDVTVNTSTLDAISEYLDGGETWLPKGLGWDGQSTIKDVALSLGLDVFLTGIPAEAALGGLMGLDSNLARPKVGNFDVTSLMKLSDKHIPNAASETQIDRLLNGLESSYKEWLNKNGVVLHDQSKSWRYAKRSPETLSVSCILDDSGNPIRFNDLVVWRNLDEEPEVISVFDHVATFKMHTNFLTLPYEIDEDVQRIMYVLHDKTLSDDGDNVVWLYKKR